MLNVFNQWVARQVPERARPWLAASNLVGLSKPNGDVTSVAIGEVLPRILARALCITLRPAMASHFQPCHQLGVGTSVGMEILTHAFRSALTTHTDWCALQIDVANAFNSSHRRVMFEGLRESPFLDLIPFLGIFYGTPNDLYLRAGPFVETLASARGSRQGDPFRPIQLVTIEFAGLLFLSYADDTYILGPASRLLEAFGMRCLWACSGWRRDSQWWGSLLERRIGRSRLRERLRQLQTPLPCLPLLDHPQMASHLLAIAVSARPEVVDTFSDWDSSLEDCFEQLSPSGTWEYDPARSRLARLQWHLPVRLGGFGIRGATFLSLLSYACGWAQAARDIAQLGVVSEEAMFANYLRTVAGVDFLDPWFSKSLEQLLEAVRWEMPSLPICIAVPPVCLFQARLRQLAMEELQAGRGAGAWVSAVPAHADFTFTAAEWSIAAAVRLGLPIQQLHVAGRCVCGTMYADSANRHHALRCKHQHRPSWVHDEVKFAVAKISKASGRVVTMEDDMLLPRKRVDVAARVILLRAASSMGGVDVDLVDRDREDRGEREGVTGLWLVRRVERNVGSEGHP
ncbi:unnamed protein product [Closterium sp. NIES-53]